MKRRHLYLEGIGGESGGRGADSCGFFMWLAVTLSLQRASIEKRLLFGTTHISKMKQA